MTDHTAQSAQRVKAIRAKTGLSQSKFANTLAIPVRTLQAWEIGQRVCPSYVLDLIEYKINNDVYFDTKKY